LSTALSGVTPIDLDAIETPLEQERYQRGVEVVALIWRGYHPGKVLRFLLPPTYGEQHLIDAITLHVFNAAQHVYKDFGILEYM